jgi:hypothetical protein
MVREFPAKRFHCCTFKWAIPIASAALTALLRRRQAVRAVETGIAASITWFAPAVGAPKKNMFFDAIRIT